jgi:hypothetical protein
MAQHLGSGHDLSFYVEEEEVAGNRHLSYGLTATHRVC